MKKPNLILLLALLFSFTSLSCNTFDGADNPGTDEDKYTAAIASAQDGDCESARNLLSDIKFKNDDHYTALGWAYLCLGGASAGSIASSIYNYTTGSTDYTSLGVLARSMLPMDAYKIDNILRAVDAFGQIRDSRRGAEVAIALLVRAASVLAAQATSAGTPEQLTRDDISTACSTSCTTCATGMSSTDVQDFTNAIAQALTQLQAAGADTLRAFAQAINAQLVIGTTAARCFIYKNAIPAS